MSEEKTIDDMLSEIAKGIAYSNTTVGVVVSFEEDELKVTPVKREDFYKEIPE